LALGLATDRIERFFDAGRRRVAVLAVLHRLVDRFDQVGRGLEIEVDGVADVEGEDLVALLGDFVGDAGEIADGIADVVEALSGWDFTNGGGGGHLHSGFGRGGFPGHGKSLNVKGGKDYAKDGRDGLGGADFTTQSRKAFDCKDRKVRQPTTESRRLTTADQRLFSIHPIDLGLLQFIGVVDVHRLPFGVEVNGADAAFAVTVAGGLGPTERKMDFGADGGCVDVGDAGVEVAHCGESFVDVLRVERRRQAILDAVGDIDGVLKVVAGDDRDDRAEDFFLGDAHLWVDVDEYGRLHEEAVLEFTLIEAVTATDQL